ncbi:MAG: hypothetical protein SynsKO_32990 [Synoicihabitans sp.]
MKQNRTLLTLCISLASLIGFSSVSASSVLPEGESYLSTAIYFQTFDEFYAGGNRGGTPGGKDIDRTHFRLNAEWGLGDRLGVDLNLGYFDTSSGVAGPFSVGSQSGLADSYIGLKYAISTTEESQFNSALRIGATIPGNYETGQLSAPGDDAFGVDVKFMASHDLGSGAIEAYAGYWAYEGAVPETMGVGVTLKKYLPHNTWLETGYHYFDANGRLNIGGPGFTGANLPQVSEQGQRWEVAAGFGDEAKRYYRISYSEIFDGRNVGREETFGISISFPF